MSNETRLAVLQHRFPSQYGQTLTPEFAGAAASTGLLSLAKDLIRWKGELTDVTPIRIYLAPWGLQSGIPIPPVYLTNSNYAQPTPWLPGGPAADDAFLDVQIYAVVMWGSGGVSHTAYVDWPRRGSLFQVSGSSVQVDAIAPAQYLSSGTPSPKQLPVLGATMSLEPGGGDSSAPGTYTYRRQQLTESSGPPNQFGVDFQVPPFARAFIPLLDVPALIADGTTGIRLRQKREPTTNGSNEQCVDLDLATFDPSWLMQPTTLASPSAGVVRIEAIGGTALTPPIGCQFHLDL